MTADASASLHRVVGVAALLVPAVYFSSEVVETVQGTFTDTRLVLTYLGEAGLPFMVLGLYAVQRPAAGALALWGAVLYAYSFVFFTGTVMYALAARAPDWPAVVDRFGPWLTVHGLVMVAGGLAFGAGVVRGGVLPAWTGVLLAVGVVAVALVSGESNLVRTVAAALPATAFSCMGLALLQPDTEQVHAGAVR